jgi:hypothetical protein
MTNQEINKAFFTATDLKTQNAVLDFIANHYGITRQEAFEEVTHEESEHILDYLQGDVRAAVNVLIYKKKIAA